MRIGIDIDNTITEIQEKLDMAAYNYALQLGKNIENSKDILEDKYNNGESYQKKYHFSYDELKYFLKVIQEEITNNAIPRKMAVEVINKLKNLGHEIYIITARDSEFHDNPYQLSKDWLDKNNILYDTLIVNARNKASICKDENIDLMIDDQLNNCIVVEEQGIQTIRLSDNESTYPGIISLKNWEEIDCYIANEKISKIVAFNECKQNFDVNYFVSHCMHDFIGRPYKDRLDVMNIEDYYIKNHGQFFIAYDVKENKIIGTIALENCGKYGILKRFYVEKNYQQNGIGRKLYHSLESYIKENTNICKVYLACGRVLEKAHQFYLKNGFEQVEKLDIDMHFAEDDDFFVKSIEREI